MVGLGRGGFLVVEGAFRVVVRTEVDIGVGVLARVCCRTPYRNGRPPPEWMVLFAVWPKTSHGHLVFFHCGWISLLYRMKLFHRFHCLEVESIQVKKDSA